MIPPDVSPDVLGKSFLELVKLAATGAFAHLSKESMEWVNNRVRELWSKKEYGITTDPDTANGLQKINNSDVFNRMKDCIGSNNQYMHTIRLALLIEDLSYNGSPKEISDIRDGVYNRWGMDIYQKEIIRR